MDANLYLEQTSVAVKQLFEDLALYQRMIQDSIGPAFFGYISDDDDLDAQLTKWQQDNEEQIEKSFQVQREYMGIVQSESAISGAILQIAYAGIRNYPSTPVNPRNLPEFIKSSSNAAKFCYGRKVFGLPIGLIIFAGRNQHNHCDEVSLRSPNTEILNELALYRTDGSYEDPCFLHRGELQSLSHNVLSIIGWKNYESYQKDISELIGADSP